MIIWNTNRKIVEWEIISEKIDNANCNHYRLMVKWVNVLVSVSQTL